MKRTASEIALAKQIGENIERVRLNRYMTPKDIAEIFKITTVAWSNLETGKTDITLSRLIKLCKVLEVPVHEIVQHELIPSLDQEFEKLNSELAKAQREIIRLQKRLLKEEENEE